MAIIYVDRLDTTLVEPLDSSSTTMVVSPEAGAAIRAAFGWPAYVGSSAESVYGPMLLRVPLYIDNGVSAERVDATVATDSGTVTVVRGTPAYAFGAGTAVRCAPPAGYIAEGFEAVRNVYGASCRAVPGETVAWEPDGATLELGIDGPSHAGDSWPARVVIATGGFLARTISLRSLDFVFSYELYLGGIAADGYPVSRVSLPAACNLAVLTIRATPPQLRGVSGVPGRVMTVEVFG